MRYAIDGFGVGELLLDGDVLVHHELPSGRIAGPETLSGGVAAELVSRIRRFFAGEAVSFADVRLDDDGLTPFQGEVVRALREIPWGELVTYGELAALAGRPGAHRAAGTVCAGNRWPLVVPCHRVVGAAGIGGYGSSGVGFKRRLLALEGLRL